MATKKKLTFWQKVWNTIKAIFTFIWVNIFRILGAILLLMAIILAYRVVTGQVDLINIVTEAPEPVVPVAVAPTPIVEDVQPTKQSSVIEEPEIQSGFFTHSDYKVWNDFDNQPFPMVENDIVFAHDDHGGSQVFYSCSQQEIENYFNLQKIWAVYFNTYKGVATSEDVYLVVKANLNSDEIARALGWQSWELFPPTVITCN